MASHIATPTPTKIRKPTVASKLSVGIRPALTFHSFLVSATSTNRDSKFIHVTNDLTLTGFLQQFRSKHKIDASLHLSCIELTFGDMILGINLNDTDKDWDWEALMVHFGKTEGLVKVVVRAG